MLVYYAFDSCLQPYTSYLSLRPHPESDPYPNPKPSPNPDAGARKVLVYVFDSCLRLLHPYMPYITEVLWQQLPHKGDALIVAPWPQEEEER